MPKSAQIRTDDLRAIYWLVGECRELGDDAVGWRLHFGESLARLVAADWALIAEMRLATQQNRDDLGTAVWGWENGLNKNGWLEMLTGFRQNPLYNPVVNAYVARMPADTGKCLSRSDMIPDRDWYRSEYYQGPQRTLGIDASLGCFQPIAGSANEHSDVFLARVVGGPDYSPREKAIVCEAVAAVAPFVGGALARFSEPSPRELPFRVRKVLQCLLEGDGDKQVAIRLGMSVYTVNECTKHLYRHFGVHSRTELLARWIRRGWGAGCAWAKESEGD